MDRQRFDREVQAALDAFSLPWESHKVSLSLWPFAVMVGDEFRIRGAEGQPYKTIHQAVRHLADTLNRLP
jgi:hypothetical protein